MNRLLLFRNIPTSLSRALQRTSPPHSVNLTKARQQHQNYINLVRNAADSTHYVVFSPNDLHPDCCFVEDCVVALRPGVVLITNPGAPSRKPETAVYRRFFSILAKQKGVRLRVEELDEGEDCDGGDLLCVGKTLFVGVGGRTNAAAVAKLADICSEYDMRTVPVPIDNDALHLKSLVTWLGREIGFVAANNDDGHNALGAILRKTKYPQRNTFINNPLWANMLRIGKTVFHHPEANIEQLRVDSKQHRQKKEQRDIQFVPCDVSELNKVDGALTCCCVAIDFERLEQDKHLHFCAMKEDWPQRFAQMITKSK